MAGTVSQLCRKLASADGHACLCLPINPQCQCIERNSFKQDGRVG